MGTDMERKRKTEREREREREKKKRKKEPKDTTGQKAINSRGVSHLHSRGMNQLMIFRVNSDEGKRMHQVRACSAQILPFSRVTRIPSVMQCV